MVAEDSKHKDALVGDAVTRVLPKDDQDALVLAQQEELSNVEQFRQEEDADPGPRDLFIEKMAGYGEWGLSFDVWAPYIQVTQVYTDGCIHAYNAALPSLRRQLRVDDAITQINGVTDPKQMSDMFNDPQVNTLEMQVIRLQKRDVSIPRAAEGESWGVNVDKEANAKGLLIKSFVKAKAVDLYNQTAAPDDALCAGDMILRANGAVGERPMVEAFMDKSAETLKLSIMRIPRATN